MERSADLARTVTFASAPEDSREVSRGDTCRGVNRMIVDFLSERFTGDSEATLLDVPCGSGELIAGVRRHFPRWRCVGADIRFRDIKAADAMVAVDCAESSIARKDIRPDVVTCVSGVTEFDNNLAFFRDVYEALDHDGLFIVTNDNLQTVRDRVMYLAAGRYGQYPLSFDPTTPTWKITPLPNLVRTLRDAGFEVAELHYVPVEAANWLWLPLAAPLALMAKVLNTVPSEFRPAVSLRALLSRHYVLICRRAKEAG